MSYLIPFAVLLIISLTYTGSTVGDKATPTSILVSTPQSYNEVPTDPECRVAVIFDNSRSIMCNVQTNRLTDGVLGDSEVNFDLFSAWNRLTSQPRIYFQFLTQDNQSTYIRQIDLYFYRNTKLQIGLPNVQLHISDQATPAEDQYHLLPYIIISNRSIPAEYNQTVKVSLITTFNKDINSSNSMLVRMTFDFSPSETLNWMLLSEVAMFTDTRILPPQTPVLFTQNQVTEVRGHNSTDLVSTVRLVCSVTNDAAGFEWSWLGPNGTIISSSSRSTVFVEDLTRTSILQINSLSLSDAGNYKCMAGFRTTPESRNSSSINLKLLGFVNKTSYRNAVLFADTRGSIFCEFSGYLPKNGIVIWENKNGTEVATTSTKFSIEQSSGGSMAQNGSISSVRSVVSTLTIMSVEHADGGNYTCTMRGDNNAELRGTINTRVVNSITDIILSVIVISSLLVFCPLFIVFCYIYNKCCIKWVRHNTKKSSENIELHATGVRAANNLYVKETTTLPDIKSEFIPVLSNMIMLNWQLRLLDIIGQGEFGIVYKSHLLQTKNGKEFKIVAVKTLKGSYDAEDVNDLVQESIKMKNFDHPNVMSLLGVCLDAGPAPYIVLPYMANGNLLSHLKTNRETLVLPNLAEDNEISIIQSRLLSMCLQIASGMQYLAEAKIVHRDLAARNCMIDDAMVIKVADFGLTKSVYEKHYFRQDKSAPVKLPIKWMAIESIDDAIFTEKTDVWSFGVTCWEIFSGGRDPYGGLHPLSIANMLREGDRLDAPDNAACSSHIFDMMMLQCWNGNPDKRPTFLQLQTSISAMLTTVAGYMELSVLTEDVKV